MKNKEIAIFDGQNVRRVWDEDLQEWYLSIVDVVSILTESVDGRKYWNKLKGRLILEGNESVTKCHQLKLLSADGKRYNTDVATPRELFRIIQSIPSKKAEPFKMWLAQVGGDRLDESQDPELTIERAMLQYKALGYSDEWIQTRVNSIQIRKELTDEWKKSGIKEGLEYAILTNLLTEEWSGKSVKEYKKHKGLKKENLRDNMTNVELALNMLAEATTSEIHHNEDVLGLNQAMDTIKRGAGVAKTARIAAEKETGVSVVSSKNANEISGRKKEISNDTNA